MEVQYGARKDIRAWMRLVREVSWNFPGLETEDDLLQHQSTVLRFMGENRAICVKEQEEIIGVLLFSRKQNRICFLAVSPAHRRQGVATMLMREALKKLDKKRDILVTTFRAEDEKGVAPRRLYRNFGFVAGELKEEFGYPQQEFILHTTR